MPLLSLLFGCTEVSALYLNEGSEYLFSRYPYSYTPELFSHFYSEENFYSDIVDLLIKQLKVKKSELEIVATGSITVPTIRYEYSFTITFEDLILNDSQYDGKFFDNWSLFTRNSSMCLYPREGNHLNNADRDYLSNLTIYKNAISDSTENHILTSTCMINLSKMADSEVLDKVTIQNNPILFSGKMFQMDNSDLRNISYLSLLTVVTNKGFNKIFVDEDRMFVHFSLLKKYNQEKYGSFLNDHPPVELGTLLNSPGNTSCLLESSVGTTQLVEIEENKLFFVPMEKDAKIRIVVKNEVLGVFEDIVSGGRLGLIIDTRQKNEKEIVTKSTFQAEVEKYLQSLNEIEAKL